MYRPTRAQLDAAKLILSRPENTLLYGGSRSGKTFVIVDYLCNVAKLKPGSRQLIARKTLLSVRQSIGFDTFPKVCELVHINERFHYNKADNYFLHENGSEIWLFGLEDNDRSDKILGKEFCTVYCNEASELAWDSVKKARTRLAQNISRLTNRFLCDCNPPSKNHWLYKLFIKKQDPITNLPIHDPENYASMRLNPEDNQANLPKNYFTNVLAGFTGRFRKRFVEGEFTDDNEFALWKRSSMIDPFRVASVPADLERIVIGVDPGITNKENSDATGIVAVGVKMIGNQEHFYVLGDRTLQASVNEWAATVVNYYQELNANYVIAETNQGGDLVEYALRNSTNSALARNMPITKVHAKKSKLLRAEPVSQLYEQGRVHHVGELVALEDEMCDFTGELNQESPNRLDALVYAVLALMERPAEVVQSSYNW
ncbi:MAG: phage terminase large subunit [Planctomycetaceae bacterium]|nr:phage terminase large subunit [Planctomycetaceae bacterium]